MTTTGLESDRTSSLSIGGCAMMYCTGQIAINIKTWMQFGRVRQRARIDDNTKQRPRYLIGYELPTDKVTLLEGKGVTEHTEVKSCIVLVNQDKQSGVSNLTPIVRLGFTFHFRNDAYALLISPNRNETAVWRSHGFQLQVGYYRRDNCINA